MGDTSLKYMTAILFLKNIKQTYQCGASLLIQLIKTCNLKEWGFTNFLLDKPYL